MRRLVTAVLAATAFAAATATAAFATTAQAPRQPHAAAQATATVRVLHGIPGLTVDVFANGEEVLADFTPGSLSDPLQLPAGSYDIAVFQAGQGPGGTPAVERTVEVTGGTDVTLTANLDESGSPALNAYVNDVSRVPAGQGRLTVRHVAAAPAVDVRADGSAIVRNLTNPDEAVTEVPAGTVSADVTLAGTDTVVIGPTPLTVAEGANTIVYAWGSAEEENLRLAVQTITGLQSAPGGVPGGTGGQAAGLDGGAPGWLAGATGLAFLVMVGAGARLLVLRRRGALRGDPR
ncbi:DUF4397 domain-containing protein [Actinomadura sp. 6K520]|uniref:DUF4397 domain-containing protein n=1 Tax=Actinomadura sp. 6K520 TaxID=2530364 RepID=UPI00104A8A8A|nr:DUF4397 domain-containing protein [Actinomadura sp. 6K520]TDE36496.1 DUF4397 domain-containing protein [Actinomadura sp. 6K520]